MSDKEARVCVVLMGVCGCGKSTVGRAVTEAMGTDLVAFRDADDLHSDDNVAKMRVGTPLTDSDRWPWLDQVGAAFMASDRPVTVIACSALRRVYRERITRAAKTPVLYLYLCGTRDTLAARLAARNHEYMPVTLLDSQLATLEPPEHNELAVHIDIARPLRDVVEHCLVHVRRRHVSRL